MQITDLNYNENTNQLAYWLLRLGERRVDINFRVGGISWFVGIEYNEFYGYYYFLGGNSHHKSTKLTPDIVQVAIKYLCDSYPLQLSYKQVEYASS